MRRSIARLRCVAPAAALVVAFAVPARAQAPPASASPETAPAATPAPGPVVSPAPAAAEAGGGAEAGYPVVVAGQEVYRMRAPLGPFSAEERARSAAERIHALVTADRFEPTMLGAIEHNALWRLIYGDTVLFTMLPDDDPEEIHAPTQQDAQRLATELVAAIEADRKARAPRELAISAALTLLVLGLAYVLLRLLLRAGRWARARIEAARGTVLHGIQVRGLELVSGDTLVAGALRAWSLIQLLASLVLAYVALSLVGSFFPWTSSYVHSSVGFVLHAVWQVARAIFGYIPNLFMIALLVLIIRYITRFVSFLFGAVGRGVLVIPGFHPELAAPTSQLARWLIWILGLVVIFPYLPGSGSPAFQGIGVFVGLLVSFGSSGAIGNVVSGVVLTYSRSFSVGDIVKISDTFGRVVHHNLLSTKLVTIKNEEVTIPNSVVLANHIVNYTELAENQGLILHTTVTIGYDAPWRQVHELLIAAARATKGVLDDPAPFVLQTALDDFYVRYEINAYTREPTRIAAMYGELHQSIQDRFFDAGVEIMSPHFSSLRDGNAVAIPPEQRPAGYEPGAFRVKRVDPEGRPG